LNQQEQHGAMLQANMEGLRQDVNQGVDPQTSVAATAAATAADGWLQLGEEGHFQDRCPKPPAQQE